MANLTSSFSSTFLFILLPILYVGARWLSSTRRPSRFPPGPPVILGLGNIHQIPTLFSYMKLHSWAKKYGPIMGLKLGHRDVVVLNDASIVYELIVKRATSFSERPSMHIAQQHIFPESQNAYSLYMNNEYNMRLRSLAKHLLVGSGLANLVPMQKAAATRMMYNIFESADKWDEHLKPWSVATPVAMMSGVPVKDIAQDFGDSWIDDYYDTQTAWVELLHPTLPGNLYPILRWVPASLAQWKRKSVSVRKALLDAYTGLVVQAEKSLERQGGTFSSMSIIPRYLRQASDTFTNSQGLDMTVFMGGLFDAAVASTLMSFHTLTLAMATNPEIQRKAQAEIDALFGDKGIPDHIDLDRLPFLYACALEGQRWRPLGSDIIGPFGLARECVKEEEILGHRIPVGSSVVINQWTIAHDPDFYDEPERYNPDRYMRDPMGAKAGVSQQGRKPIYTFGAGRRECLGRDYYLQQIRIAYSQVLWAFDIVPDGPLDIDVQTAFTPATVLMPKPFKVRFVPRREAEVLLAEKKKADEKMVELLGQ